MAEQDSPFVLAPPPWSCKCTAYALPFFYSASSGLPADLAYAPLEAASSTFSSQSEAGGYKGGLCMLQIIRYTETPVGPYDEMALLPGDFSMPHAKEANMRITRIYVSQKDTCYNVQPPLPEGKTMEECSTTDWIKAKPELRSKATRMVWWDMKQPQTEPSSERDEGTGSTESDTLLAADRTSRTTDDQNKNWWPGLGRWRIGLWLDDAVLELGEAEKLTL
ncbi:MAG: hypothetical protein Q9191_002257 [Dirinaria sp. TL-2023a]